MDAANSVRVVHVRSDRDRRHQNCADGTPVPDFALRWYRGCTAVRFLVRHTSEVPSCTHLLGTVYAGRDTAQSSANGDISRYEVHCAASADATPRAP